MAQRRTDPYVKEGITPQSDIYIDPDTGEQSNYRKSYLKRMGHVLYDTPYKERDLTSGEQMYIDLVSKNYEGSNAEKIYNQYGRTKEDYIARKIKSIIRPRTMLMKTFYSNTIKQLEAGADARAATKKAAREAELTKVQKAVDTQKQMSAISKAGSSQFGAAAVTAGMTGAGSLVSTSGLSSGGAPASTGASLIAPTITKSVAAPKETQAMKTATQNIALAKEAATESIKKEIEIQKTLAPIRQRRRKQAQAQASLLRRGTGRGALLSSPAGGAGFFGGYFKG